MQPQPIKVYVYKYRMDADVWYAYKIYVLIKKIYVLIHALRCWVASGLLCCG